MGVEVIQRYSYYVGQSMVEDNDEGQYVLYKDHKADMVRKEASLAAEKEKVRELVEGLKSIADASSVESASKGTLGEYKRGYYDCYARVIALIEKYKKEPNNE